MFWQCIVAAIVGLNVPEPTDKFFTLRNVDILYARLRQSEELRLRYQAMQHLFANIKDATPAKIAFLRMHWVDTTVSYQRKGEKKNTTIRLAVWSAKLRDDKSLDVTIWGPSGPLEELDAVGWLAAECFAATVAVKEKDDEGSRRVLSDAQARFYALKGITGGEKRNHPCG